MTDSLSPVALSRLTWTADDRRAWEDTYRHALLVAVGREWCHTCRARGAHRISCSRHDLVTVGARRYSIHTDNYGKGQ